MEQRQEDAWAAQQAANLRAAQLLEEEKDRQRKVMAHHVRAENEHKAVHDHARDLLLFKLIALLRLDLMRTCPDARRKQAGRSTYPMTVQGHTLVTFDS
ncbi:hypothetical protein SeMB42_g06007 [Synchytrium endobioticum]|uniref:Uncharacterized protein n=1 Tax=Synchytrium endobioticum TaxID=286115 RepID=A0A507CL16_9FUNG|nr:hypothetical protein SeMB42_g06007 [Synchytrium endobioticum]